MAGKADASAGFAISLKDETSGPAHSAGAALTQLRAKIDADTKALKTLQQAQSRLKGSTLGNAASLRTVRAQIDGMKASIAGAQGEIVAMGGHLADVAPPAEAAGGALASVLDSAKGAGGPLGHMAGRLSALANPMTAVVALATAGVAAFAAFAAAVIGGAVALGRLALSSADAARSERLHLEGLTTLRNVYGVAAGSALDLVAAIDHVSDASALSRTEVSGMAESLYRAGLRGGNLQDALGGLSIAQSVQGDQGARRFRAMAVSIARTGGSVRRLADDYRQRLGGIASRQAMSLARLSERLHESIGRIFADVRIEGFLGALSDVVRLFSQTTVTGRALHQIATTMLSPIFDSARTGTPALVVAFQRVTLTMLNMAIGVNRVRLALRPVGSAAQELSTAWGDLDRVAHLSDSTFAAVGATLRSIFPTVSLFVDSIRLAFAALDAPGAGRDIGEGLAAGIRASAAGVRAAAGALGADAEGGVRDRLDTHSPSRVFAAIGRDTTRGFARGMSSGGGDVSGATESMAASATGGASSGASSRGPVNVSVSIAITGQGASAGREAAESFVEQLSRLLEGAAIEMGALSA